jgi:hypothetical protein
MDIDEYHPFLTGRHKIHISRIRANDDSLNVLT